MCVYYRQIKEKQGVEIKNFKSTIINIYKEFKKDQN